MGAETGDGYYWTPVDTVRAAAGPDMAGAAHGRRWVGCDPDEIDGGGKADTEFRAGVGGTGLEPVTPSLSSWCSPN